MKRHNEGAVIGPARTCVGCRERRGTGELFRITLDDGGRLIVGGGANGPAGRPPSVRGRGVWLCRDSQRCAELALRSQAITRGLRVPVSAESLAALAETMGIDMKREAHRGARER